MSRHDPAHPCESVLDAMHHAGLSAKHLAAALNMERGNLCRSLRGDIVLSLRTAVALEALGWSNAEFWCRRKALYDLARYRRRTADPASAPESR